ncbi:MAG TPA: efflux RND transporter permease subunit [Vicinamibacteria bacterium]|nr:efflux RND transporter permease subunit [Vicinamibacteria bacterium]
MRSIEFSVRRPVTVAMTTVAVVLFGLVALQRLPINLLPDLSYPSLTIETRFAGAAPAEVETLVTRPLEEAVGVLAGVRRISSRSRPGLSQVVLEFDWGREMSLASLDVRQKVDLVVLPKETEKPVILRFDPASDPILRLYLTGGSNLYRQRYVAEEILKKDLESIDGVAAVKVSGGLEEEIQVRLDEQKLALVGLTPKDVQDVLARENVNQAGGSLYEEEARYLVRANNEFRGLDDILRTIVSEKEGRTVRVADLGTVARGHKRREVVTRFGGQEAVELAVYKEGDANTVRLARAVRTRLQSLEKELPEGVKVGTGVDQSRFIESSIDEVMGNALLGGLLAMIVLYLFLKDVFSTLIVGISIPVSIVATFFLMYRMGVSLNIMSLGGLALGVGMLVDNAIVVLEAIFSRRERGEGALEAASKGASEVGMAVVASTLTTVAVFLPVVFVEGFAAQLFRDQALTVSFSLLASLAVALTLIPMIAARGGRSPRASAPEAATVTAPPAGRGERARRAVFFVAPAFLVRMIRLAVQAAGRGLSFAVRPVRAAFDRGLAQVLDRYPKVLARALDRPALVLGVAGGLFVAALAGASRLGLDLVPSFSQGEFSYHVELPEGTPLSATDRALLRAQHALEDDPSVEAFSAVAGGAGLSLTSTGTEGENFGQLEVRMKAGTSPAREEAVIGRLRQALAEIPQARVKFQRPSYFSFRTPVEVEVFSDRLDDLHQVAGALRDRVSSLPGLVDVKSSAELGNPELQVRFDRDALARLGLDLSRVSATVRGKVRGEVATRFNEGDREIDILVRTAGGGDVRADEVERVIVDHRQGTPIYLGSVARISRELGPSEIRRIGQRRAAVVSANLAPGTSLGGAASGIREVLRAYPFPASVLASLSGQEEERQRSFSSLLFALGLALFLVYLVMASQFESLVHPLVILFTVPLAAIGVVGALLVFRQPVNVVVMIGVVMLGGIVVNNAIVLVDAVRQLRQEGVPRREALLLAGTRRLRPILMTTGTTVLGLLPMALGLGEGAELRTPLAVTVIGGLGVATLLTLVVIPVVYQLADRVRAGERAAEAAPAAADPALAPPEAALVQRPVS